MDGFAHLARRQHGGKRAVEAQRIARHIATDHLGSRRRLGVFDADLLKVEEGDVEVLNARHRHIGLGLALPAAAHVDDAGYAQIVEEDRLVIRRRLVERCAAEEESRHDGATIPADDLPFIFERFYKVDKAHTSGGGTGLGLAIVKRILEQHGQTISVTSAGGLTTFVFTLERAKDSKTLPSGGETQTDETGKEVQ